ncbi:MAG: c-type cytochrome, partial [Ferruginibacter sp.]|nr:c-type cytochrome [Chitinophagaceae bacterium]
TPGSDKREIFCTGTRFPVAMAFNEEGDLFATDQEGATCWHPGLCLPNGNPFDELLHIQEGRHYGFPPRNPKYLPTVIDEPSVFDYKPQHQSTCGINFNLPVNNGPAFGPSWWRGDAFLAGYSRGKIYRTKLVKTDAGYVAENSIIACLISLTVDACISPKGDMVVSTHSGFPDWGFGPKAKGKLYKIVHNNTDLPNPVATWTSKPDEVSIAFDKPVNREYLKNLADKITIKYGQYTHPGDRFEVVRPGYKTVERQLRFPVENLEVKNVALSENGRTLIITTFQHILPNTYAITLPYFSNDEKLANSVKQSRTYDLAYTLNGVYVSWQSNSGSQKWNGWLPHLDMKVSKAFMEPVAEYNDMQKALIQPGTVTWKTQLNLLNMLRPELQPESPLDYTVPPEDVTVVFRSSEALQIKVSEPAIVSPSVKKGDLYETGITFNKVTRRGYPLEITMNTSSKEPVLLVHYYTNEDPRARALQIHRFFVPWASEIFDKETLGSETEIAELAGGNWSRGRKLFYTEALCANCHTIGGKGKDIGPDLSNLIFKDYTSVLRDIHDPSSAINPDYVGHTVVLKDKT